MTYARRVEGRHMNKLTKTISRDFSGAILGCGCGLIGRVGSEIGIASDAWGGW